MIALFIVALLLVYLPWRLGRGFTTTARFAFVAIVVLKAALIVVLHERQVQLNGHPIILDLATDAKNYYDAGAKLSSQSIFEVSREDVVAVASGHGHLGYYYLNYLAFALCPDNPMLLLRLAKLLLFHIGLGMLVTTWRLQTNSTRAMLAYIVLGVLLYQFTYSIFRNLKDSVVLSLFMMIMALIDRSVIAVTDVARSRRKRSVFLRWTAIALLTWAVSTFRFYVALLIPAALVAHAVFGRGIRLTYRLALVVFLFLGSAAVVTLPGMGLVEQAGGIVEVFRGLTNIYGLFKAIVSPYPWQHTQPILAFPHTLYLLMLIPAGIAFFMNFRQNLDWKLFVVLQTIVVVGGVLEDFAPRKRYMIYPILVSWIVTAGLRHRAQSKAAQTTNRGYPPASYWRTQPQNYGPPGYAAPPSAGLSTRP